MSLSAAGAEISEDRLLGGRVVLRQPRHGYRAAIDPVLLAAAAPAVAGRVLDLGCGTGAALLCYGARVPGPGLVGLEVDPASAALARENARLNGQGGRVSVHLGDVADPPRALAAGGFELVLMNPPHDDPNRADPSPDPDRRRARVEGAAGLAVWLRAALRLARPRGRIVLIHRADRLDAILAGLGRGAGAVAVLPLAPGAEAPAKRVIVTARKDVRTPLTLRAPLVLHGPDGAYAAKVAAALNDAAPLA